MLLKRNHCINQAVEWIKGTPSEQWCVVLTRRQRTTWRTIEIKRFRDAFLLYCVSPWLAQNFLFHVEITDYCLSLSSLLFSITFFCTLCLTSSITATFPYPRTKLGFIFHSPKDFHVQLRSLETALRVELADFRPILRLASPFPFSHLY